MPSFWTARLLPASFRGIPFFIDSHEFSGGRNVVSHEPPDRNSTFGEDIGRKSQGFKISGHVLGDTYFFIRDALINAMENGQKGILIHPYLGVKEVLPASYSFTEDTKEGRICRFSLEFVEAGEASFPLSIIDAITDFATSVVATVAQVQNAFQVAYSLAGLPGYCADSAEAIANDFVSTVNKGISKVRLDSSLSASLTTGISAFSAAIPSLVRNAASFIGGIDDILVNMRSAVAVDAPRTTIDISSGRSDSLDIFTDLIAFDSDNISDIPSTTATRLSQAENAAAIQNAVKQLAAIRLAENAAAKEFDSIESSIDERNKIVDVLDEQLSLVTDDDLYNSLALFKSKVLGILPQRDLAFVEDISILDTTPSLALTYDLYQSLDNELDVIERNRINNPCFIQGDLKVLSG